MKIKQTVKSIFSYIKRHYIGLLTIVSIFIIIAVFILMVTINLNVLSSHIDYSPDFPVYRSSDSTLTALIKNELIATGKNVAKTQRSMEGNNTSLILAFIGILAGLFLNPLILKVLSKVKTVDEKVDKIEATNAEQHAVIHNELKIYKTETKTLANLNEILGHHLEVAPVELSEFIAHEGRRLIYFADVAMNSKFDFSIVASSKVKLDIIKREGREEIKNLSSDFRKDYNKLQCFNYDRLYDDLSKIVYDQVYNSKSNRFRMVCEQVLNNHLTGILEIQRNLHNHQLNS